MGFGFAFPNSYVAPVRRNPRWPEPRQFKSHALRCVAASALAAPAQATTIRFKRVVTRLPGLGSRHYGLYALRIGGKRLEPMPGGAWMSFER